METWQAAVATEARYHHAEGPGWDARTGRLLWIDQYAGHVHVGGWDRGSRRVVSERRYELGSPVGAVVPDGTSDGWIAAAAQGFVRLDADGTVTLLPQPAAGAPRRMRMNDGKCDPAGRFWAGNMAFEKTPGVASLFRLDPDLSVTTVLDGVTISNGLDWTDGGATMYYIDTPTQRVDRFRVTADGRLTDRTPVVRINDGSPDGMTLDAEGCLWVAVWGAGAVHRYAPTGELLAVVDVGAPQVSSCAFGGPDGRTLFITTSQEGYDDQESSAHPDAGRLFAVDVDVAGSPAAPFGAPA
jgi:sugar lactone lactonase YvrE